MSRFLPLCALVLSAVLMAVLSRTAAQDSSGRMCGRLLVRRFQQLCMDLKRRRSVDDTEQSLVPRLLKPHPALSTHWENVAETEPERGLQLKNKRDPDSETEATDIFDVCCERGCSTEELVIYCGLWHTS